MQHIKTTKRVLRKKVLLHTEHHNYNTPKKKKTIVAMLGVQCNLFFLVCPRLHCIPKNHKKGKKHNYTTQCDCTKRKIKHTTNSLHCITKGKKEEREERRGGRINLGEELGFKLGSSN
jgi:hypothetical protein